MKLAFISGPFRAPTPEGVQANIDRATEVAWRWWKRGYAVICPHLNTSAFAKRDGEYRQTMFLPGAIEMLSRCDLVVMMPTWEHSEGARAELAAAISRGIRCILDAGNQEDTAIKVEQERKADGSSG